MNLRISRLFLTSALAMGMLLLPLLSVDALAKRAGGGGSFGSRPSYNRTYTPPASPSSPASPSQMNQQRPTTPPPATPAPQPAPGFGSRMGWGLGGFLMGGLLGSMLFGGGFGGGFGGIGLMDILLIGGIIFLAFKLLRGRSASGQPGQPGQPAPGPQNSPDPAPDPRSGAEQSWDRLRSTPPSGAGSFGDGSSSAPGGQEPAQGPAVPEGFNVPEFIEGAKTVYTRIQGSWDRRDMADIALFTTPEVHQELSRQAQADPGPSRTELLMVNARLVEYREEGTDSVATVLFDVLMREDASEDRPKQVREVWHFSREIKNPSSTWRLEGIQQLEG